MRKATSLALIVVAVSPAAAWSQPSSRAPQSVTITLGGGGLIPYRYPERPNRDLLVSLQVPVHRSVVLEAEVIRSTAGNARSGYYDSRGGRPYVPFTTVTTGHEAVNAGANVLLRKRGARLTTYFGGGLGLHRAETITTFFTRCQPREPGGCDNEPDTTNIHRVANVGPSWQLIGGIDAQIAPRLLVFGSGRWLTTHLRAGDTGLGAIGGIRFAFPANQRP